MRAWAIVALSGIGSVISAYLTWVHQSSALALCGGFGQCEEVNASPYAEVLGVPVAALGLALYLVLMAGGWWQAVAGPRTPPGVPLGLFGLSLAGVIFAGYLTAVEFFVLRAVCPWCLASAGVVGLIFLLAFKGVWHPDPAPPLAGQGDTVHPLSC